MAQRARQASHAKLKLGSRSIRLGSFQAFILSRFRLARKLLGSFAPLWLVVTMRVSKRRNWLDLPSDLMINILQRVGAVEILENAQNVCVAWRDICRDPMMWTVVYMDSISDHRQEICMQVVDRSQGQLLDLTIFAIWSPELLQYVADRSSQLRHLAILCYFGETLSEPLKKLSLLEELSLTGTNVSQEDIEAAGRYCPLLKTFRFRERKFTITFVNEADEVALAIGKHLPELTHLELTENSMTSIGLQAILDGCCHLESLDLRGCWNVDLRGDLGERCFKQVKNLKLPHDYLEMCLL